jgi:hypothetical protein
MVPHNYDKPIRANMPADNTPQIPCIYRAMLYKYCHFNFGRWGGAKISLSAMFILLMKLL